MKEKFIKKSFSKKSKFFQKNNKLNNIYNTKISNENKFKKKKLVILILIGCFILSISTAAASFTIVNTNSNFSKTVEPPLPQYQNISNEIVKNNSNIFINDANLKKIIPSNVSSDMLTVQNLNLNINAILDIDINLIKFEILRSSVNDFSGSLDIYVLYNNFKSTSTIKLNNFSFTPKINILIQPSTPIEKIVETNFNIETSAILSNDPSLSTNLKYEWYKDDNIINNSSVISGVKTNNIIFTKAQIIDSGNYKCKITYGDVSVFTNAWNVSISESGQFVVNNLAEANKIINITDQTLKNTLPSSLNLSNLNLTNIPLDTSSISNFNNSLFSFESIYGINDILGTIQLKIKYNNFTSSSFIYVQGFKTIPNLNLISISPNQNNIKTQIDKIASDPNFDRSTVNFKSYFQIKNFTTNVNLDFDTVVGFFDIKKELISNKLRLTFSLSLNNGYSTTSSLVYSYTSSVNMYNFSIGANNYPENFSLTGGQSLAILNNNIVQLDNKTNIVNTLDPSNLFKLIDEGYKSATFVKIKKIIQNQINNNSFYFLVTHKLVISGKETFFDSVFKVIFNSTTAPSLSLLINMHFKNKESSLNFTYTTSNSISYSVSSDRLFVFPEFIQGTSTKIIIVKDVSTDKSLVVYSDVNTYDFFPINSSNIALDSKYFIKDSRIQLAWDWMTGSTTKRKEFFSIVAFKENDPNKKLYFTTIEFSNIGEGINYWYDDTGAIRSNFSSQNIDINNFYSSINDSLYLVSDKFAHPKKNIFNIGIFCKGTNKFLNTEINGTNGAITYPKNSLNVLNLSTTASLPIIINNLALYISADLQEVQSISLATSSQTPLSIFNISKQFDNTTNQKITEILLRDATTIILATNYGNRYIFDTSTSKITSNLKPF